ncbi:MAG: hypothetical protein CFE36_13980 [Sphingomonadaceae bacterium PASS1]|nr:MAG: hypothetical protein CFE36_13980 [Sphingomonadaceae bacterium PASS1]
MDKYIIPMLLGLTQDSSKNAPASFLEAWNPDGDQIELANLIIEQLTNTETTDHVVLTEELANALMDPEISDLLPEAGALKIVNMLNMGKMKDSTTR